MSRPPTAAFPRHIRPRHPVGAKIKVRILGCSWAALMSILVHFSAVRSILGLGKRVGRYRGFWGGVQGKWPGWKLGVIGRLFVYFMYIRYSIKGYEANRAAGAINGRNFAFYSEKWVGWVLAGGLANAVL